MLIKCEKGQREKWAFRLRVWKENRSKGERSTYVGPTSQSERPIWVYKASCLKNGVSPMTGTMWPDRSLSVLPSGSAGHFKWVTIMFCLSSPGHFVPQRINSETYYLKQTTNQTNKLQTKPKKERKTKAPIPALAFKLQNSGHGLKLGFEFPSSPASPQTANSRLQGIPTTTAAIFWRMEESVAPPQK